MLKQCQTVFIYLLHYYTVSQKNPRTLDFCPWLRQMLTDFQNNFTERLTNNFAIKSLLNIPPHLKHVATLPCEIFVLKKLPCSRTECSRLAIQKNCRKIIISLIFFIDTKVKHILHSNITRQKAVSVHHM